VPWIAEENRFTCPCHASAFDITGQVISAPAPRALDIYPVSIENGNISVDTQQPIQRSGYRKEQTVYPESV
jgi:Rieske Fe-S protein